MALNAEKTAIVGYSTRAKWTTVRIETDSDVFVGRIYVPETKKRLSDVLNDDRTFVSLAEAASGDGQNTEAFVAINKSSIRTVRVLHEGDADVVPIRLR